MRTSTSNSDIATPLAVELLEGIYQHRLLCTVQLHDLYRPARGIGHVQQSLRALEREGMLGWVRSTRRRNLWFITAQGAEAVEAIPTRTETRRKLIDHAQAAGPLQQHTLAVNDVGIAFATTARTRGDECGPLSWRHEIAHPLGPPPGRRRPEQLITDAVLGYQLNQPDGSIEFAHCFIELDRATMAADQLAAKLNRYGDLYHHTDHGTPVWQTTYPDFPTLLLVLAGREREALERRRRIVLALIDHAGILGETGIDLAVCLLIDLQAEGPFAPIFLHLADRTTPTGWLSH